MAHVRQHHRYWRQQDLVDHERAIRHLIGEKAAASKTKRLEAEAKLVVPRNRAKSPLPPAVGVPSGDRFPDVSNYQVHVDLAKVRHDDAIRVGKLIVLKATEALDFTDGFLVSRWRAAAHLFPHRGAYHFLHPEESGTEQARFFLEELHRASTDGKGPKAQDIVACDAEVSNGQPASAVARCVADFGAELKKESPAKRWLYTGGPFAQEFGLALHPYDAHWLAAYVGDPRPYFVPGWGNPVAWQFTDGVHGPVPHAVAGIGACDVSIIL